MAEEIVAIKIIGDEFKSTGKTTTSEAAGGAGNMVKGMGGMMKTVLSGIGIGSVIGIVAMIAGNMKSLMNLVGSIIKMISFLVKPIADVIMVLLMPILMMLKPVVLMVNQIMAPFIKLGMQLMREGMTMMAGGNMVGGAAAMGAGASVMMSGLSSVIVALSGGIINMLIDVSGQMLTLSLNMLVNIMATMLATVFPFFSGALMTGAENINLWVSNAIGFGVDNMKLGVDAIFGEIMAVFAANAAMAGETFGINTDEFQADALDNITNIFSGTDGLQQHWADVIGFGAGFGKIANEEISGLLGVDGLDGTFTTEMINFKEDGTSIIEETVTSFKDAMAKLSDDPPEFGSGKFGGTGAGGSWDSPTQITRGPSFSGDY